MRPLRSRVYLGVSRPGYDLCWQYIKEFNLPYLYLPRRENMIRFIDGKMYTEETLADRNIRIVAWPKDPWASACERIEYRPGQLRKFWPVLIEPMGRIHFAGAYADNLHWSMEAATRSGHRVVAEISGR